MNQDQVKEKLLLLNGDVDEFKVTFSGKKSKKVDGLYKPADREIIIHNHNFDGDGALIYTAIHEFAHHIQFTTANAPVSCRSHTNRFWDILHRLLFEAEKKGIYENVFEKDRRFAELTVRIRDEFLVKNGHLMKELGGLLSEAMKLCRELHASFDDYVDRELKLHRTVARTVMKINLMDIDPEIGYENMRTVARIRDDDRRRKAERAFADGKSPDMVKAEFGCVPKKEETIERLESEKKRIEKSLESLTIRLTIVEKQIEDMRARRV
ncbi:MAG TPA: hypothetical protein VLM75_14675 [Spirochaetota bacterium]|nr:hypothetical protein [Spirochaetota bacterium]